MEFAVAAGTHSSPGKQSSKARARASSSPMWTASPAAAAAISPQSLQTSLPPLGDSPASPRKEPTQSDIGAFRSPFHTASDAGHFYNARADRDGEPGNRSSDAYPHRCIENDYPMAQLDSWPLTSRTTYKRPIAGGSQTHSVAIPSSPEKKLVPSSYDHPTSSSAQILRINHEFTSSSSTSITSPLSGFTSPISPRQRKVHQRQNLLDESKSKPLLLQELQAFVNAGLAELEQQSNDGLACNGESSPSPIRSCGPSKDTLQCCLQRLQVFRQVFQRVISSFSVYAPVLAQIQEEYERVVTRLRGQCLQIPALHSQLQTLQTRCVHEISAHSLEAKVRSQTQKKQLKATQGRLTALAAQNALLAEQNAKLEAQIARLESRSTEMQLSNHSLVNGMKRHDDTLRHIHERSREEGQALTQMSNKYHHACEEIAELKRTIATLEEKVGGVHVAADKATIALLTKELQEVHGKLQDTLASTSVVAVAELQQSLGQHTAIVHAFAKVLEGQGVGVNIQELLAMVSPKSSAASQSSPAGSGIGASSQPVLSSRSLAPSSASGELSGVSRTLAIPGSEYVEATDVVATWALDKLLAQTHRSNNHRSGDTGAPVSGSAATFLTEPEETLSLESASRALSSSADFFPGKGFGADVPEYLQCDGVVRNLHFPKKKLEQILARVWQQKDDLEKIKRSHFASISNASGSPAVALPLAAGNPGGGGVVPLAKVFSMMLNRMCTSKAEAVETAYNVLAALERFAPHSSDCRLFLLIVQGEVPEDARQDRVKELYVVHDALAALEKERSTSSGGGSGASGSPAQTAVVPGRVPLADVLQLLRHVFPWKTDAALSALYRSLLIDQRGSAQVDYAALLLQQQEDKRVTRAKPSQFAECLRAQYIDDVLAYRRHLQSSIQHKLARLLPGGSSGGDSVAGSGALANEAADLAAPDSNGAAATPPSPATASTDILNSHASTSGMISIRMLRDFLQECDVAKPVQEINRLLATAAGLSMDQILTQDAMTVSAQQFLRKLPTLLVKPTGKFQRQQGGLPL